MTSKDAHPLSAREETLRTLAAKIMPRGTTFNAYRAEYAKRGGLPTSVNNCVKKALAAGFVAKGKGQRGEEVFENPEGWVLSTLYFDAPSPSPNFVWILLYPPSSSHLG